MIDLNQPNSRAVSMSPGGKPRISSIFLERCQDWYDIVLKVTNSHSRRVPDGQDAEKRPDFKRSAGESETKRLASLQVRGSLWVVYYGGNVR